ncbi:MAG TPA: hypothetical protein VKX49_17355 [Bryobacteraceae bacterium]|nr:hypothetical protein [Bryobacteraceae bacterium]
MAGPVTILSALARSVWRDLRTFSSVAGNNITLFVLLVMYQQPQSAAFFLMILAVLVLGPLSADPLRKVPPDRLALWPLSPRQRIAVRLGSLALSPVVWVALPFFFWTGGVSFGLILIVAGLLVQVAVTFWSHRRAGRVKSRFIIPAPKLPGRWGGLIQKNVRQMLSVLDPYAAFALALGGMLYRIFGSKPDPDAFLILALVVVIAVSTYGQCLFGLDLPWGIARYRVLPLRGFEILLAKDIAFLCVAGVLAAPLAFLPGLAGAFVALAVGHHASVARPLPQTRWRFTGGTLWPDGFFQVFPLVAVGVATGRASIWYFGLAVAAYVGSLWYYGRQWDRGA